MSPLPRQAALLAALLCLIADPGEAQFFDTRHGYNPYGPSGGLCCTNRLRARAPLPPDGLIPWPQ